MNARQWIFATILVALGAVSCMSATMSVSVSVTPDAGLFDYTYLFSIGGAGPGVDNIFLGSDDISPLNVVLRVNNTPTVDWSWLGNDSPQNYLQFFDVNGTSLGSGDALDVMFSSQLGPQATHFAVGLDSTTGATTNTTTVLAAPSAAAIPEPGSLFLLGSGFALFLVARTRRRRS